MLNQNKKRSKQPPLIPVDVAADLPRLQASYFEKTGTQFKHFFCPFMYRDEQVQLCMGHVLPESYANCSRARVAQRADMDNFYGCVAEADYGTLLESQGRTMSEIVLDKKLLKELRPQLMHDGEEVVYYPYRGEKNLQHTRIAFESAQDERSIDLVLKKSPTEMQSSLNNNWGFVTEHDFRLAAIATIVKAAFLTMFHLHGYSWAMSPGGTAIGYDLLGKFFRDNRGNHVTDIKRAMLQAFTPYKHILRPIVRFGDGDLPRGTLEDGTFGLCFGSNCKPFAQIIYVRIGDHCDGVLLPAAENPDSAATYCEFLNNDHEKLKVSHSRFNNAMQCWEVDPKPITVHWPKKHSTFDFE